MSLAKKKYILREATKYLQENIKDDWDAPQAVLNLAIASAVVTRQGSGLIWEELEEVIGDTFLSNVQLEDAQKFYQKASEKYEKRQKNK